MAAGDTSLSICSDALILLGAAPISSFTEGSDAAQACDRLYPDLRDTLLFKLPLELLSSSKKNSSLDWLLLQ